MLNIADQRAPLNVIDGGLFVLQQSLDHAGDFLAQHGGGQTLQHREVKLVEQFEVHPAL